MIKASDSEAKQLIQKRLLQTIAASLVDQLGRSGFHWSEIVELANELLEHIIELQVSSMSSSSSIPVRGSDPSVFAPEWARARSLHVAGHVSLDSSAYVRWLKQADLASLVRWQADEVISRTLATKSLEYIVARQQQNGRREMRTCLTICRKADERPIGLVGLINLDEEPRQAELTKMIGDVAERGRGYARMATRVLLAYAFEWLGVDRVFLRTIDSNLKNIALNQSLGFSFEGLLRQAAIVDGTMQDVVIMSLLRSDFPGEEHCQGTARHPCVMDRFLQVTGPKNGTP